MSMRIRAASGPVRRARTALTGGGDAKSGTADTGSKGNDTNIQSRTQAPKQVEDNYMVIVGTPTRLDEVESMARTVDTRICGAMGVRVPMSNRNALDLRLS